ncbi:hypothetical protein IFM89_038613 [Coptis chinensis]|uniref:Plant heme peroxidase family profile domain-containing protein n=1 Tax=Coptis chinensis TaxID=261450 RepID=A0A835I3Z9_9MAGN|nr:hypothetical protein IFM89_038613 [Coptis chinensis]
MEEEILVLQECLEERNGLLLASASKAEQSFATTSPRHPLKVDFYSSSCPHLEQLLGSVTSQQFKEAPVSAPATIRLFFHDCFIEGCDVSILISTKAGSAVLAKKDAQDNKHLVVEAFDGIKNTKALVESKFPGIVSCADIVAIAARDFVHLVLLEELASSIWVPMSTSEHFFYCCAQEY